MKFRCIKKTVLNGQTCELGKVVDSQVDIRQYSDCWEVFVEPCEVSVEVPKPRITRIKK